MDAKTPTILPVSIQEVRKLVRRLFCALLALLLSATAFAERAEIKVKGRNEFVFDTEKRLIAHSGTQNESALAEALAVSDAFESLIRLHVIAESDSEIAQARKLKVRDAVLECVREMLGDCENAESAWSLLNERLGEIESAARIAAEADGFSGEIRAETGVFPFPDRDYGGVFVPAGDYRAVRIVIGAGEGRNWWCVLYPTLCVPPESAKRSVIVEWIRAIFGLEESR